MFLQRNQLVKRKIVGGNILGNLLHKAKRTLYNTSKILLPKAKSLGKMTAQKALTAAKEQITPEMVFDLAKDAMKKDTASVKQKLNQQMRQIVKKVAKDEGLNAQAKQIVKNLATDEELNPHVRDTISRLATNKNVKKVLTDKSKELMQSKSRAILSNLMAGSGLVKH